MEHRYHINIFWSELSGRWVADVPDLRFCSAHGDTPEEALTELETAMELWLDTAREEGIPVPEPAYRADGLNSEAA
jgi:predicted RNase H-like HicB family nuclease